LLPQAELKEKLHKMYNAKDVSNVFVFGFRTQVHSLPPSHFVRAVPSTLPCEEQVALAQQL